MKRNDICPTCGTSLRWEDPDDWGMKSGSWFCPRCKYRRLDGSPIDPFKFFRKHKRRGKNV